MKQAWNDLSLLLAGAIERHPRATRWFALLVPIALVLVSYFGAVSMAVVGGLALSVSLRRNRESPTAWVMAFVVLSVGAVWGRGQWFADSPHEGRQSTSSMLVAALALALPFVLMPLISEGRRRSQIVLLAALLGTLPVMLYAHSKGVGNLQAPLRGLPAYGLGLALGAWAALRGRKWTGTLICLASVGPVLGVFLLSPQNLAGSATVLICTVLAVLLFARAAGHASESACERADAALARWVCRVQHRPWAFAVRVAVVVNLLRWALGASALDWISFRPTGNGAVLAVLMSTLFLMPALLGAVLAHTIGTQRSLIDRLAPMAAAVTVLGLMDGALLFVFRGLGPARLPLVLAVGAAPAALAASIPMPTWSVRQPLVFPLAIGLLCVGVCATFEAPALLAALLVLGVIYRVALVGRPSLVLSAVFAVAGTFSGGVISGIDRWSDVVVMALVAVVVPWPVLALGRLFGSATAVPKTHPIYVDFGGPVDSDSDADGAVLSPAESGRSGSTSRE